MDLKENRVHLEIRELQDHPDLQDLLELWVQLAPEGNEDVKDPLDPLDCVVLMVLRVPQVPPEVQENQVLQVSQVVQELREIKVSRDLKDLLGFRDHEVNLESLVPLESQDPRVPQVKMASLEKKVHPVNREMVAPQVFLVPVDHQDYQVVLVWLG